MNLVTGATGLLGSHIAEKLRQADQPVRALVRDSSDTRFLESIGVELARGDLNDADSIKQATRDVEVVYHSAAKVGDWGPWEQFQEYTIDGTQHILDAAADAGVRRLVHISSISAYGHPDGKNLTIDETCPIGQNLYRWAYYTKAKVEAERRVRRMFEEKNLPITIIRPSWIYGQRDRTSIARIVDSIRTGKQKIIGKGDNRLNTVYAGNVADGCLLSADSDKAVGEAYNLSNDGVITQEQYFNTYAECLGCPPIQRHVPFWLAYSAAFDLEVLGHLFRKKKPPFITRYAVWLIGRQVYYSTEKAQSELGWRSRVSYDDGIRQTVQWYLDREKE